MNYFLKTLCLAGTVGLLATQSNAQQSTSPDIRRDQEIVIRKKTDKDTKVTIEINGDDVKVNGKPLAEFQDNNVDIDVERSGPRALLRRGTSISPFRGSAWNYEAPVIGYGSSNRAVLGVTTEKGDNGARVKSVTKGSAAEKAGIKEGDIITTVEDATISSPEDLTKAIGKHKPEDKVSVTVSRDKKTQRLTATLTKPSATSVYSRNFNFDYDHGGATLFNGPDGFNLALSAGTPRLGIRAQDTDDGKGVKVLDVDNGSAAEKSGIKAGDLITEFDGKSVNGATELVEAARNAKDKNGMKVKLTRDGKSQELELKIPKKLKTANL